MPENKAMCLREACLYTREGKGGPASLPARFRWKSVGADDAYLAQLRRFADGGPFYMPPGRSADLISFLRSAVPAYLSPVVSHASCV